jgi:hypothetical protein
MLTVDTNSGTVDNVGKATTTATTDDATGAAYQLLHRSVNM